MGRIEEIREREGKATPGPWYSEYCPYPDEKSYRIGNCEYVLGRRIWRENADFIAHAREDIPFLLGEVERLSDMVVSMQNYESATGKAYNLALAQIGGLLEKISRLTAERDAAVSEIERSCGNCAHYRPGRKGWVRICGQVCTPYEYAHLTPCDGWEWRDGEGKDGRSHYAHA